MRCRAATSPTGRPRISARPDVGKISCISSFSVVVLPGAVRTEKTEDLSLLDVERQTVERPVRARAPETDLGSPW